MKYTLFSAPWCTYCTPVKKFIEQHNLPVSIVDIDQDFEQAQAAGVRGIPALLMENGSLKTESKEIIALLKEEFVCQ